MLIPHLHFNGTCREAIAFYQKVFNTTVDCVYDVDPDHPDKGILHAEMHIGGIRIMLNDQPDTVACDIHSALHLIITFKEKADLVCVYELLRQEGTVIDQPQEVGYSPCIANVMDRFGIRWGLMI